MTHGLTNCRLKVARPTHRAVATSVNQIPMEFIDSQLPPEIYLHRPRRHYSRKMGCSAEIYNAALLPGVSVFQEIGPLDREQSENYSDRRGSRDARSSRTRCDTVSAGRSDALGQVFLTGFTRFILDFVPGKLRVCESRKLGCECRAVYSLNCENRDRGNCY